VLSSPLTKLWVVRSNPAGVVSPNCIEWCYTTTHAAKFIICVNRPITAMTKVYFPDVQAR
jgi:hypothetical protein